MLKLCTILGTRKLIITLNPNVKYLFMTFTRHWQNCISNKYHKYLHLVYILLLKLCPTQKCSTSFIYFFFFLNNNKCYFSCSLFCVCVCVYFWWFMISYIFNLDSCKTCFFIRLRLLPFLQIWYPSRRRSSHWLHWKSAMVWVGNPVRNTKRLIWRNCARKYTNTTKAQVINKQIRIH